MPELPLIMPDKQYPPPPIRGTTYAGEIFQTGLKSYLISVGVEGSEAPSLKGEYVGTGPYTSLEGIRDWIRNEVERLSALGGEVSFHFNNAAIIRAGLEDIIRAPDGVILDLRTGQFPKPREAPKLPKS